MSSLGTCTVQAFEVDLSYGTIKSHCDKTHTQLSVYVSHQFEDLLQKGEKKWGVPVSDFEKAFTLETTHDVCRFRIRKSVKKKIEAAVKKNLRLQGYQLSYMLYVVAQQIQNGTKRNMAKK